MKIECQETHIYIWKHNAYKQSECSIIWGGKGKELALIKRVKLTQEFVKSCLLKVGPSGAEKDWSDTY